MQICSRSHCISLGVIKITSAHYGYWQYSNIFSTIGDRSHYTRQAYFTSSDLQNIHLLSMKSNISMTSKIKLFHIFQDFTPISGVFLGHLTPNSCARSVPMKNFPGSHKYDGWRRIRHSDVQYVKGFTWARFPSFKFTQEKRINRNIFGKQLRMDDVSLIYCNNCKFLHSKLL